MINQRLKQLRAENNLTQTNLADILGIAKTTLAAYEQGKSEPSNETILKLPITLMYQQIFYSEIVITKIHKKNLILRMP